MSQNPATRGLWMEIPPRKCRLPHREPGGNIGRILRLKDLYFEDLVPIVSVKNEKSMKIVIRDSIATVIGTQEMIAENLPGSRHVGPPVDGAAERAHSQRPNS